jgi:hypothetical protein
MPAPANNGFEPEEFAKLLANFDTGNPNEASAINAARLLRRSLVGNGLRLVDVMGRCDVMAALDAQLQPVREESPELKAAFLKIASLAELAKQQEDFIMQLQSELAGGIAGQPAMPIPPPVSDGVLISDGLVVAAAIVALALIIASAWL